MNRISIRDMRLHERRARAPMWPSSAMARDAASTDAVEPRLAFRRTQAFHVVAAMFECSTSAVAWNCAPGSPTRARPGVVVACRCGGRRLARDGRVPTS